MKLIKDYPPETQWQTRNGQQTGRHVGTLKNGHEVFIMDAGNFDYVATRYPDGRTTSEYAHDWDLIPVPVKRTGWVNVYRSGERTYSVVELHGTREAADVAGACHKRIACIRVDWTDGEGLS